MREKERGKEEGAGGCEKLGVCPPYPQGWAHCLSPSSCTPNSSQKAHVTVARLRNSLRMKLLPPGPGEGDMAVERAQQVRL